MDPQDQVTLSLSERWDLDEGPKEPARHCGNCEHKFEGAARCAAFPRGIPERFLMGEFHGAVVRGQKRPVVWTPED